MVLLVLLSGVHKEWTLLDRGKLLPCSCMEVDVPWKLKDAVAIASDKQEWLDFIDGDWVASGGKRKTIVRRTERDLEDNYEAVTFGREHNE